MSLSNADLETDTLILKPKLKSIIFDFILSDATTKNLFFKES